MIRPALILVAFACAFRAECLCAAAPDAFDLQAAVANLQPGAVLELPPGVHRLPRAGWRLAGLRGVIIDGRGATLLAGSRETSSLQIDGCDGLTIRNLRIDYDPLPFTQGDIASVDAQTGTITVQLHAGYPGSEAAASTGGVFTDARLQLFDRDTPTLKPGAPDYGVASLEPTGERAVRVSFPKWQSGFEFLTIGDRVTLSSRAAEGVSIRNSREVTLEDVTVLAAPNVAIVVRSCETGGTYRRVRVIPGPPPQGATQPRLISACADGLNVANTRLGPVVEQCEFAYQADDAINFHGAMIPVLKWIDDRSFLSVLPWRNNRLEVIARPGDAIRFLAPPSYEVEGAANIVKIEKTPEPVEPWLERVGKTWEMLKVNPESVTFYRVTLDQRPPGVQAGGFCEIPATSASGFLIRDTYCHDHRGRGFRLMASDGLVVNNRFERIKGCAISLGAEFSYWREAGWSRNLVVSGNQIRDVGQGWNIRQPDSYTHGAISIMARTDAGAAPAFPGNENIVLEGNLIDGCSVAGISISNAHNVRVSRNTIRNVNQDASGEAGRARGLSTTQPISIIRAEATLSDNLVP